MNKIEKMIKEMCPNGVEFDLVGNLTKNISAKIKLKKEQFLVEGKYPIIDQGKKFIVAYTNDDSAIISKNEYVIFGEHTCEVKFIDFEFAQGADGIKILKAVDKLIPKFLYYCICNCKITSRGYNRHWTILKDIKVPIPPLDIQNEIVKILDTFTELEAELEAELEERKKQYVSISQKLLKNNNDNNDLFDLTMKIQNINWKNEHSKRQYIDLSSVDRGNDKILNTITIDKDNAPSRAKQIVRTNDILIGTTRPLLKRITIIEHIYENQICSTGFCVLRFDENKIYYRWAYHNLKSKRFYDFLESNQQGTSYPCISDNKLKEFKLPNISLEEQYRIADILDYLDKLVNNINEGLPAEISCRKNQYEYYRNKLLNFKELVKND